MTCDLCRQAQRDGFKPDVSCEGIDHVDTCPTDEVPKLDETNQSFMHFFIERLLPGLFGFEGTLDYQAIRFAFDTYGTSRHARPFVMEKILAIIRVLQELKQEERHAQS